jgi:hypothetical protein
MDFEMITKIKSILAVLVGLSLATSCRQNELADDPELLKKVVVGYFDGITNKDFGKMKEMTTKDFVLYEDGAVWNNDSVFNNIRKHLPFSVRYKLQDFNIHVDQASGDMTYQNHADFVFDGQMVSLDWIESATFRKTEEGWKMNFLHLTIKK